MLELSIGLRGDIDRVRMLERRIWLMLQPVAVLGTARTGQELSAGPLFEHFC